MAKLRKYEYINDIRVYEVELTDEQLKLYQEDEDQFMEEFGYDLDYDFVYDKVGDPSDEYELVED
jgi:hypothetical protein